MSDYPQVGDRFGPYRITGEIGHGGMGVVFSAVQEPLNRPVALKVLDPRLSVDAGFVDRFIQEGALLARMNSPHVIQIYDHGQISGCLFLAMQHVGGGDLAHFLKEQGRLPVALAAGLSAQVASALADAHASGIIHRDIKPSNVLLTKTGSEPFVYLCDFGIAQADHTLGLTQTGMLAGSLSYMAPERHEGRPADERGDLYSLGCLFWALISGEPPYRGTDFQVAQQHVAAPAPQLAGSGALVVGVNQMVARMLAKDPAERPASAVEAATWFRHLERVAESEGVVEEQTTVRRPVVTPPPPPASSTPFGATVLAPPPAAPVAAAPVAAASEAARSAAASAGRSAQPGRTRLVVAAIVVAALGAGAGLWGLTALLNSGGAKATAAVATTQAPAATTTSETPTTAGTGSRQPARERVDRIRLGANPHGVAIDSAARRAYVANYGEGTVSVLDLDSNQVIQKKSVGKKPQSVAVDPAVGLLLVGCDDDSEVRIFKLETLEQVGSAPMAQGAIRVAVSATRKVAYAVAMGSGEMSVISLESFDVVDSVPVGDQPRAIGIDDREHVAYVGHWSSSKVSVVDLDDGRVIDELDVGQNPNSVAIAPQRRLGFVASYGDAETHRGASVAVIDLDTKRFVKALPADEGPSRIVVDEDAGVAYLTCLYANTVDVYDLDTLVRIDSFEAGTRPTGLAVDSTTGRLFVTSFDKNVVNVYGP